MLSSAVLKVVGSPLRGTSLQALENLSTTTRMQVCEREGGRFITPKSTPRWGWVVEPVFLEVGVWEFWRWHGLNSSRQIGRLPKPRWATNSDFGGARVFAVYLVVQSPEMNE